MSSFSNALAGYRRKNTVQVDCGGGLIITIRSASAHNQEFRAKVQEYLRGKRDDDKVVIAADPSSITGTGDPKKDAEFFYNTLLVTWRGLRDDNGKDVKCTRDAAIELFSGSEEGQVLLQMLTVEATKDANFTLAQDTADEARIAGE